MEISDRKHIVRVRKEGRYSYFDIFETKEDKEMFLFSIKRYNYNYGIFVNELISIKYPYDKMQAIINNYLLDPENTEAVKEFNEMQEYRAYAKEVAKECIKYIKENNLEYGKSSENN